MNRIFSIVLFLVFTINIGYSQKINTKEIDHYIDYIEQNNQELGNISIFKDGKEVYNRSFGQSAIPNLKYNEKTKYKIASITKLFTATLIWQLIEDGKLRENQKLADFFPDMPNAKNISINNLLEHSSGLGDYVIKQDSLYFWLENPVTEEEIEKEIKSQGVLFDVGEKFSYSNSGYYLLRKIIEAKHKMDFGKVLHQEITKPFNLLNTYSILSGQKNIFPTYIYVQDQWEEMKDLYLKNIIGVGDMISTPYDLNKFINLLFNYKILSKETMRKLLPQSDDDEFGRGLYSIYFNNRHNYGHSGDTFGTHSLVEYNPKNKLSIAYCITGEVYPHNDFSIDISKIIYDIDFEYPAFNYTKVDPKEVKNYLGIYESDELPIDLTITEKDSVLTVQPLKRSTYKLEQIDTNKFIVEDAEIEIKFKPEVDSLILSLYGDEYKMNKRN